MLFTAHPWFPKSEPQQIWDPQSWDSSPAIRGRGGGWNNQPGSQRVGSGFPPRLIRLKLRFFIKHSGNATWDVKPSPYRITVVKGRFSLGSQSRNEIIWSGDDCILINKQYSQNTLILTYLNFCCEHLDVPLSQTTVPGAEVPDFHWAVPPFAPWLTSLCKLRCLEEILWTSEVPNCKMLSSNHVTFPPEERSASVFLGGFLVF